MKPHPSISSMPNHNHHHYSPTKPTHGFNRGRHHHRPNPRLQSWEKSWENQSWRSLRLQTWGNLLSLTLLLSPFLLFAQPNTPTKIADILATLPATSNQAAERNYAELLATGAVGLGLVCEQVAPSGQAAGVAPRYAVSLLTHYAKAATDKALIEKAYLQALGKASDTEVKAYFISNIQLVGTTASVKP